MSNNCTTKQATNALPALKPFQTYTLKKISDAAVVCDGRAPAIICTPRCIYEQTK